MEKSYSGQTLTRFQAASHLANAPLRQQPEHSLEDYLVDNNSQLKTIYLLHRSLCEPSENLLLDEKKKDSHKILAEAKGSRTKNVIFLMAGPLRPYPLFLTKAVLLWFHMSSSSVIQICPF